MNMILMNMVQLKRDKKISSMIWWNWWKKVRQQINLKNQNQLH